MLRSKPMKTRKVKKTADESDEVRLDSIMTMDDTGRIHSVSDDIEKLLGWTPAELCGRNVDTLIPEPKRSELDRFLDRYRSPGKSKALERSRRFDAMRKNGTLIPIELSVSRAEFPGQVGPYFIGILRDKSGQMDVETDTPEERTRLQRFVTEQTRAMATSHLRLQLSDRLVSLGMLAAGLGHDLNNVLLPLRAQVNAVEHAGVSKAAAEHLTEVRRALMYLQQLSNGLHVLSIDPVAEDGALDAPYPTDIQMWWSQVGTLLRTVLPRRVKLTCTFPKQLPCVAIAPHLLTQAVMNVFTNAGDAIPVEAESGKVVFTAQFVSDQKLVKLSITDNGKGMTRAVQMRACDPFFTTKPRAIGTGLGLPLAKKAIEQTGGRIEIVSAPGKGSTISLLLPTANSVTMRAREKSGRNGKASGAGSVNGAVREPRKLKAAVTLSTRETEILVNQMLAAAGFKLVPAPSRVTGRADVWVTEPNDTTLRLAGRWRAEDEARKVILMGTSSQRNAAAWAALGSVVVDDKDDFRSFRSEVLRSITELQESFSRRGY